MAVDHMAEENKNTTSAVGKTKADDLILKLFWILSEGDDNARVKAAEELVAHLQKKQDKSQESKSEKLCPSLEYSLERLVRGLSSGRKWSRIGFSLVLTQILRSMSVVSVKMLLDLSNKHLNFSSHVQKREAGGMLLGQAFVFLSLIQSNRLVKGEGKEHIGEIFSTLYKLCTEKMYLQSVCCQGLILLIKQMSGKMFVKRILPCVQKEFSQGWRGCTMERLLIALAASVHHQEYVDEVLATNWTYPIVSKKTMPHIVEVLKNCYTESKIYVQVCDYLAQCSLSSIPNTWSEIGCRLLQGSQQHHLIAGCLLNKLLVVSSSANQIEELLNFDARRFLISFPSSPFVRNSKLEIHDTILNKISSSSDPQVQLALVKSLLRAPAGPSFDRLTKSQTLSKSVKALSDEAFTEYFSMIEKFFTTEPVPEFSPVESSKCKSKAVFLFRLKTLTGEHQTHLIKLLFLRGYFQIENPSDKLLYCDRKVNYDEEQLKAIQNGYLNCLANFHSGTLVQSVHRKKHLDLMVDLFNYATELLNHPDIVSTRRELSPKEQEAWNKVVVVVREIADMDEEKRKLEHMAFLFLLIHFGLQILTDSVKLDLSLLEDVQSCYKKAFEKKKKKKSDDDPEWIEVMTEVMLNMMSHSFQLARVMSSVAFKLLVDNITPQAVEQITTVMLSKFGDDAVTFVDDSDEDEEDSDEEGEEEEDDNDEDAKSKTKKKKKEVKEKKMKKKTEDSSEDEVDMEVSEEFNAGFRRTVKEALGDAAADSNDEDGSDWNDSDMEKIDDKLSAAFKSLRKPSEKKKRMEEERQFIAFKTRVLDLTQILLKSDIRAEIAVSLVLPLLKVVGRSYQKDNMQEFHIKAQKSFECLYHQKHMKGASEIDTEWLFSHLKSTMQFATKANNLVLVKEVSNACLYIMKLLLLEDDDFNPGQNQSQADSNTKPKKKKTDKNREKVLEHLKLNLNGFLYNGKEYRFHPGFFNNMFEKYPKMFWCMTGTLVDVIKNKKSKVYFKTTACGYLTVLLVKKICQELPAEEWKSFESSLVQCLNKYILEFDPNDNYKPKFLQEILNTLYKMMTISPDVKAEITEEVFNKVLGLKPKFCKNTRQAFNRFRNIYMEGFGRRKRKQEGWRNPEKNQDHLTNGSAPLPNGDSHNEEVAPSSPSPVKQSKKQNKKQTESDSENVNPQNGVSSDEVEVDDMEVDGNEVDDDDDDRKSKKIKKSMKKKKRKSEEPSAPSEEMTPPSGKKSKLSKSFHVGDGDLDSSVVKLSKKERKRKKSL